MTQSERRFSCSIGIDMGAKYTGVFYALFDREELPTNLNSKAMTLVMPETGPRYVQAQRTAVRHRLRGQKRYTLARKLAFLVVDDMMKKQEKRLTDEEWKRGREALSGLLKRRGYSRPNADGEDLTPLEMYVRMFLPLIRPSVHISVKCVLWLSNGRNLLPTLVMLKSFLAIRIYRPTRNL